VLAMVLYDSEALDLGLQILYPFILIEILSLAQLFVEVCLVSR